MKSFAFITTCMGRLEHAKLSSQLLMADPRIDGKHHHYVFVDFACPQESGTWIETTYGERASVVKVKAHAGDENEVLFHKSLAMNLGAGRATELGADYLVFIDADFLANAELLNYVFRHAKKEEFMVFLPKRAQRDVCGFLGVPLEAFYQVNGFDQQMIGWGAEDIDMRLRLYLGEGKLTCHMLPIHLASFIGHSDELRHQYSVFSLKESNKRNMQRCNQNMIRVTGKTLHQLLDDPFSFVDSLLGIAQLPEQVHQQSEQKRDHEPDS